MTVLRDFLKQNRIFFEVIAATALTTTSIYVSFKANNIAERQMEIMELENTPRIEIQRSQQYSDSTKTYQLTKWKVFNNNSKISNFEIEKEISYINIVKKNSKEISIPLVEYINRNGNLSGQYEGLIYEFNNENCFKDEFITRQELANYGDVDVKSFIELSYTNVLGKKEIIYFQILPLVQQISNDEWTNINDDWTNKNSEVLFLKNIEQNIETIKNHK